MIWMRTSDEGPAHRHRLEWRRLGRLGLKLGIRHRLFNQPIAVEAHAAQINLRRGDASRRLQDIGLDAFADDPLRQGFHVARQIGITPDRHVETVTKRVLRRLRLAGHRLRTRAGARIGPVRPNFAGACHAASPSVKLDGISLNSASRTSSAACRSAAPRVARCRSISRRAIFRRASAPATMRSMRDLVNFQSERLRHHLVPRQAGGS